MNKESAELKNTLIIEFRLACTNIRLYYEKSSDFTTEEFKDLVKKYNELFLRLYK